MLSGKPLLYTMTMLNALSFLLIGYGVMGGVSGTPGFLKTFNLNPKIDHDNTMLGTIVATYELGCFAGSILCSLIGERIGRRYSILLGTIIMIGGTAFQSAVSTQAAMIGARIVAGLGMGFINSTAPVLQAEISPSATRGRYVCFQLSLLNLGIMLAYWVGYGFSLGNDDYLWRIPVALQAVFQIPMVILCLIIPESPRWLAAHDKKDECLQVIARLKGRSNEDAEVRSQFNDILDAVALEKSIGSGRWRDLLREDEIKSRRRLLIACSIQFFQQAGGINALIYYGGTFLTAAGLDAHTAALISGVMFTWFFVASFIPWFLIDTVGRRKLLLVCISLMAVCFCLEAGLVYKVDTTHSKAAGGAATAFLFVYLGLFTIGFQAVVWVYPSEILPLRLRQKGSSISTACNWITNYAVVQITPIALKKIHYKFYIVFAVINAAFLPPIYFFYPETKGMNLEDVDRLFAGNNVRAFEHDAESKHTDTQVQEA
ncbi:hypothetical protein CcaverHIS002_0706120 [Cutaneotrichosporon cavernicola]|nr:hypothetical protein CcaverHIS002_0706120 [Cutaneotrichosporon cavernicola]BEJ02809.1 hypothetical protein CcaverHIS631_0706040 [Cutaneotrichosporon cavernicola]